jgi:hypothetical protein
VINITPIIIKIIPNKVVQLNGSLNKTNEKSETIAIAPAVSIGCATFNGNLDKDKPYNMNAKP